MVCQLIVFSLFGIIKWFYAYLIIIDKKMLSKNYLEKALSIDWISNMRVFFQHITL